MEFVHKTVLLHETIDNLNVKPDGIYVDGTLGGGGHTSLLLSRLSDQGRVIGIDQDIDAIETCKKDLQHAFHKIIFVQNNFKNIKSVLYDIHIDKIDGAVLDLGVSSYQLDNASRGFSYMHDAPLDMRMNQSSGISAKEIINTYSEETLTDIIFRYGEERYARRIAGNIVRHREKKPVETTGELVGIIKQAMPAAGKKGGHHPAKRTFQAIRIAVNDELGILENTVSDFFDVLQVGGRLAVITFHSLEDRIIKTAFHNLCTGCTCPPQFPVCVCGKKPRAKLIARISPSQDEIEQNPRARSARLRVIERIL